MNNGQVAERFVHGNTRGKSANMFIEGNAIYSYGYHFPIAYRLSGGRYLFNQDGYSSTTTHHKSLVFRHLNSSEVIFAKTSVLKDAIARDANNAVIIERKQEFETIQELRYAIEQFYKARNINTQRIRNRLNPFIKEMERQELICNV